MNWGGFGTVDGWLAIIGLAVGTFAIRYSFIGLLAGKQLPPRFERALHSRCRQSLRHWSYLSFCSMR